jgi:integrase
MRFRMPCPIARKGTRNLWFYERIPVDVVRILSALPGAMRPKGWGKNFVWLSLGTPDAREAKAKCAVVSARYLSDLKRIREISPEQLSAEDINALQHEAVLMVDGLIPAVSLRPTLSDPTPNLAERILASEGVVATPGSLSKAEEALQFRLKDHAANSADIEKRRAAGDHGALLPVPRGKTWKQVRDQASAKQTIRLSQLVEAFKTTRRIASLQPSATTFYRYRAPLARLVEFLGDPIATAVTTDDLRRFRHHKQTDGITEENRLGRLNTVNSVDMVAIRSLFGWACNPDEHDPAKGPLLLLNPALPIKIKTKTAMGITGKDHPGFFDSEWRSILQAATETVVGNETPAFDRARKWVPWIAAYTGRRITSICGLTCERFVTLQGVPCIVFPPEKGISKPSHVPLHPHLLEEGLLELVKSIGEGPLFHQLPLIPEHVRRHLVSWIKTSVGITRKEVSPNHAWRSTFISIANDPEATGGTIPSAHVLFFAGHTMRGLGVGKEFYDRPPVSSLAASMARFPRYDLIEPATLPRT